jgi:tetratricopeptide (TPR) repeat protein
MNRMGRLWIVGVLALAGVSACKQEPPDPAREHRNKGNKAFNDKEWKKAIEEYELSLQVDPKQAAIWEQKAFAHLQLAEADKVEEAVVKTSDLVTDTKKKNELYRNLASMFVQQKAEKSIEKAEQYFLKAVEANPNDDLSLAWLAEIYAQRGGARTKNPGIPDLLEKAFGYYDKAIALNPTYAFTYVNKRIAVNKYMEYQKTQKDATELLAKAEKNAAKRAELKAKADEIQARLDSLKKEYDDLTQKYNEARKNQPAKK